MSNIKNEFYLSLQELAKYSSFSVSTLRGYLSDPENPLPYFRVKRKILVKKSEFDRWMENFRGKPSDLDILFNEVIHDLEGKN